MEILRFEDHILENLYHFQQLYLAWKYVNTLVSYSD